MKAHIVVGGLGGLAAAAFPPRHRHRARAQEIKPQGPRRPRQCRDGRDVSANIPPNRTGRFKIMLWFYGRHHRT
jgi:hypothetical protein